MPLSYTGYVQGMSDLCAPLYIVMAGNEEMTFWCFVEVMNRMVSRTCVQSLSLRSSHPQKQNFLRDQSGMKRQLSTLQQLIEIMDPELFRHLGMCFQYLTMQLLFNGHLQKKKPMR